MALSDKDRLTLPANIRHSTLIEHGWTDEDIINHFNPAGFTDGIPTSSSLTAIKEVLTQRPDLELAMMKAAWPQGLPSVPPYGLFKVHYLQWALSASRPLANGELHHLVPHRHKAKRYVVTTGSLPHLDRHYKRVEVLGIAPSNVFPLHNPDDDIHGIMFNTSDRIYKVFASARNTISGNQCLKIGINSGSYYRLINQVIVPDSYQAPESIKHHTWEKPYVPFQQL